MDDKDFTRIRVGGFDVGIIGLKQLMEQMAKTHAGKSDEEVAVYMVRELSSRNYIPGGAKDEYGDAFLREFRRSIGQEKGDTRGEGLVVKVLGMGCAQCHSLTQTIMELLTELGFPADLEHITDIKEIARYGAMGSPALVINGKIAAVGKVPPRNQIKAWLVEANRSVAGT
jgi:small redox-active disulfide protein 2